MKNELIELIKEFRDWIQVSYPVEADLNKQFRFRMFCWWLLNIKK